LSCDVVRVLLPWVLRRPGLYSVDVVVIVVSVDVVVNVLVDSVAYVVIVFVGVRISVGVGVIDIVVVVDDDRVFRASGNRCYRQHEIAVTQSPRKVFHQTLFVKIGGWWCSASLEPWCNLGCISTAD